MSKFKFGDRVKLSKEGLRIKSHVKLDWASFIGTVVPSTNREDDIVPVIWDGRKVKEHYHQGFLESVEPPKGNEVEKRI